MYCYWKITCPVLLQLRLLPMSALVFGHRPQYYGFAALLKYTKFGKAMKAVADDEEVAKIVGINTKIVMAVFGSATPRWYFGGVDRLNRRWVCHLLKGVIPPLLAVLAKLTGDVTCFCWFVENFGI